MTVARCFMHVVNSPKGPHLHARCVQSKHPRRRVHSSRLTDIHQPLEIHQLDPAEPPLAVGYRSIELPVGLLINTLLRVYVYALPALGHCLSPRTVVVITKIVSPLTASPGY
jgi:hypothetical protein